MGIEDMHRLFFTNSQGVVSNPEANENVGQIKDEDGHGKHGLPRAGAIVDDQAVSLRIQAFFVGDFFSVKKRWPTSSRSASIMLWISGICRLGNNEHMHGRLGVRVLERDDCSVLEYDLAWNFFIDNFAENTVRIPDHDFFSPREAPEKAAARACMARRADRPLPEASVLVAIIEYILYRRRIWPASPFCAEFLARTAPEPSGDGINGFLHGFSVHVSDHQEFTCFPVLDHGWGIRPFSSYLRLSGTGMGFLTQMKERALRNTERQRSDGSDEDTTV